MHANTRWHWKPSQNSCKTSRRWWQCSAVTLSTCDRVPPAQAWHRPECTLPRAAPHLLRPGNSSAQGAAPGRARPCRACKAYIQTDRLALAAAVRGAAMSGRAQPGAAPQQQRATQLHRIALGNCLGRQLGRIDIGLVAISTASEHSMSEQHLPSQGHLGNSANSHTSTIEFSHCALTKEFSYCAGVGSC